MSNNNYTRIAISKENKERLDNLKTEIKDRHQEARHRPISYNEIIGRVIDFWQKN